MKLPDSIIAYIQTTLNYKAGQSIFNEGGLASHVFIVMQGRVRVRKQTPKGMVTLAVVEQGHVLGETSFFDTSANLRAASAVAETDVQLGVLDLEKIKQDLAGISPVQQEILVGLARRLRLTTAAAALLAGGGCAGAPAV